MGQFSGLILDLKGARSPEPCPGAGVWRVRPHSKHQFNRRPRPPETSSRPCSPVAGCVTVKSSVPAMPRGLCRSSPNRSDLFARDDVPLPGYFDRPVAGRFRRQADFLARRRRANPRDVRGGDSPWEGYSSPHVSADEQPQPARAPTTRKRRKDHVDAVRYGHKRARRIRRPGATKSARSAQRLPRIRDDLGRWTPRPRNCAQPAFSRLA